MLNPHYISMDNTAFQHLVTQQFPSLDDMVYVNHAAISPWPQVCCQAVQDFAAENCARGPMQAGLWLQREKALRKRVGKMLNASSVKDIAFLKNTTEGICMVANGVDWQAGDNIVSPREEFISNRIAWEVLQQRGVELRRVATRDSDDPEGRLLDAMDARTRVLTASSVRWDDGFRLDLERLGRGCRSGSALFFVDAIQQFGALRMDVQACRIDAFCAGAHKWQMGPEGIAVFYCNENTRRSLFLSQHGWRMLDNPYRYARPDLEPSATARRFEAGSPNTVGQAALHASLGLLSDIGLDEVQARVLNNTHRLIEGISAVPGLQLQSDHEPKRRSGIVSLKSLNTETETLRRRLARLKVYVAVRGDAIRLSPHFYQDGPAIEKLLNALEDEIKP